METISAIVPRIMLFCLSGYGYYYSLLNPFIVEAGTEPKRKLGMAKV